MKSTMDIISKYFEKDEDGNFSPTWDLLDEMKSGRAYEQRWQELDVSTKVKK